MNNREVCLELAVAVQNEGQLQSSQSKNDLTI